MPILTEDEAMAAAFAAVDANPKGHAGRRQDAPLRSALAEASHSSKEDRNAEFIEAVQELHGAGMLISSSLGDWLAPTTFSESPELISLNELAVRSRAIIEAALHDLGKVPAFRSSPVVDSLVREMRGVRHHLGSTVESTAAVESLCLVTSRYLVSRHQVVSHMARRVGYTHLASFLAVINVQSPGAEHHLYPESKRIRVRRARTLS